MPQARRQATSPLWEKSRVKIKSLVPLKDRFWWSNLRVPPPTYSALRGEISKPDGWKPQQVPLPLRIRRAFRLSLKQWSLMSPLGSCCYFPKIQGKIFSWFLLTRLLDPSEVPKPKATQVVLERFPERHFPPTGPLSISLEETSSCAFQRIPQMQFLRKFP